MWCNRDVRGEQSIARSNRDVSYGAEDTGEQLFLTNVLTNFLTNVFDQCFDQCLINVLTSS